MCYYPRNNCLVSYLKTIDLVQFYFLVDNLKLFVPAVIHGGAAGEQEPSIWSLPHSGCTHILSTTIDGRDNPGAGNRSLLQNAQLVLGPISTEGEEMDNCVTHNNPLHPAFHDSYGKFGPGT